ncbi:peptidylprolyl isomerase [bacterium]|jgi:cyclophilin family peptidyl-prolyl cis-trans isomerase|nr:peptidylprolyl isomerase [bacterium]
MKKIQLPFYTLENSLRASLLFFFVLLTACGVENAVENTGDVQQVEQASEAVLVPLPGNENSVPALNEKVTVLMRTGSGELTIDIFPAAAPNAAARFLELVEAGFYDNTPVFRVVPGFVAQFGINWRDDYPTWQDNDFDDDPSLFALERGTLAFAKAGPNTNSTQVFINYVENNRLAAPAFNFTVFGMVVAGMEAVDAFLSVGDPNGGLDQERLWNDGGVYLESLDTKPVMIEEAFIVAEGD